MDALDKWINFHISVFNLVDFLSYMVTQNGHKNDG